jgi:hypothetical protein
VNRTIFHKNFKAEPFWWEAHRPQALAEIALPREARDTLFLLAVIGWTVLPHLARLPWWCVALSALVLVWRAHLALGEMLGRHGRDTEANAHLVAALKLATGELKRR